MKIQPIDVFLPSMTAIVGCVLLAVWINTGSPHLLEARVPGLDSPPVGALSRDGSAPLEPLPEPGDPVAGDGVPSAVAGQWTGFRGSRRDNISDDPTALARAWPPGGPPELWRIPLGEGYASAAIQAGRVYLLDYDEEGQADVMRCLSLDDGREIWRNGYPVVVTRNHGISRTVPVVVGDRVISMGPRCHVACWDADSGQCHWLIDLAREHGTIVPRWYTGQCPLVDQDRLILAPCGDALLMAVDYQTGEIVWESPNPRRWEMSHVSIVPMDFQGRHSYVYCGDGGVAGVAADDGSLLWDNTKWPVQFAHAPSPLILPEGRIFLSSGYGSKIGALVLQLQEVDGRIVAEIAQQLTPKQFNSEQQTPILLENHIFGVRKRGGGQLVCLDLNANEIWNSGSDRFGHGPYMIADGVIFVMDNNGKLTMAEATTAGYRPLASHEVFDDGHDAWAPMALVGGRLVLRDMSRMVCLDVAAR